MPLYRANYGDGETSGAFSDIRDARLAMWSRAGIVQYRTSIERHEGGRLDSGWFVVEPSRATRNGPPIVERVS